jgi:hypothetical protein
MHPPPALSKALLLAAAALALAGCDAAQPSEPGTLVVEAFVRTGEPLDALTLRQTQPLGRPGDSTATGADVRLTLGGEAVPYRAAGPSGRYVPAPGGGRVAQPGTPFALQVDWNGQQATAAGRIPPPIRLDTALVRAPDEPVSTVLVDSLRLDSLDVPAEQGYIYPVEVELAWQAPAGASTLEGGRWIQARLNPSSLFSSRVIDFFLQPAATFREPAARAGPGRARRWEGVYAVPADSATAPLPPHRLRIGLVRADSAYARFVRTRDASDQRAPDGNVRGALGIASGVAVDRRTLRIGD